MSHPSLSSQHVQNPSLNNISNNMNGILNPMMLQMAMMNYPGIQQLACSTNMM